MVQRYFTPPTQSYFIFGPRGTGKSTWLKQHYKDAYWIDLLDPESFRLFSAAPERLKQILHEHSKQKIVIIDEIQKVPDLLNVVHSLIEEKRGYQFILTGSSARKLRKEGVNLLGGRALVRTMSPFFASELGADFDLPTHLRLGMLPIVLDSPNPEDVLKAYAGIYLKEEVQAEGIVRNVGDFARFMEAMSFSHASLINASNIARECQIARKTVDGYLLILDDLLLSFQLQVFKRKAKRAVVSHSKFYFFDTGVYNSLRSKNYSEKQTEHDGIALEGLVAQHLKGWVDAQGGDYTLNFWRTSSNAEVDFVIYGPKSFVAIEVKNGLHIHPSDLRGLFSFQEEYPEAELILLYRGKHKYKEKNITCYPVDDFLLKVNPNNSFPSERRSDEGSA
ncbi:MAG: ATP-binding protein [Rhabdochlamydiaceae bacterium]|nr:ATP-binding protein [Rhabdochlamydiaceae bacterium]